MSGWVRYPPPHGALLLPLDARALAAEAVAREAACRPAALLARSAATRWIRRFGAGSLGARAAWSPGLAPGEWNALLDDVRQAVGGFDACAVWERRQASRRGFALLLGGARGPVAFQSCGRSPRRGWRRSARCSPRRRERPAASSTSRPFWATGAGGDGRGSRSRCFPRCTAPPRAGRSAG